MPCWITHCWSFTIPAVLRVCRAVRRKETWNGFWKERQNLIDAMLRSNLSGMLVERAVSLAKQEELMPGYVKDWENMMQNIAMSFVVCGLMSMVIQWHREGYRISAEKMAQAAVAMLSRPLIPKL